MSDRAQYFEEAWANLRWIRPYLIGHGEEVMRALGASTECLRRAEESTSYGDEMDWLWVSFSYLDIAKRLAHIAEEGRGTLNLEVRGYPSVPLPSPAKSPQYRTPASVPLAAHHEPRSPKHETPPPETPAKLRD